MVKLLSSVVFLKISIPQNLLMAFSKDLLYVAFKKEVLSVVIWDLKVICVLGNTSLLDSSK